MVSLSNQVPPGTASNAAPQRQMRRRKETSLMRVAFDATYTYIHMAETSDVSSPTARCCIVMQEVLQINTET